MIFETKIPKKPGAKRKIMGLSMLSATIFSLLAISFGFLAEPKAAQASSCSTLQSPQANYNMTTDGTKITSTQSINVTLNFTNISQENYIDSGIVNSTQAYPVVGTLDAHPVIQLEGPLTYTSSTAGTGPVQDITSKLGSSVNSQTFAPGVLTPTTFTFSFSSLNITTPGDYKILVTWKATQFTPKPESSPQLPQNLVINAQASCSPVTFNDVTIGVTDSTASPISLVTTAVDGLGGPTGSAVGNTGQNFTSAGTTGTDCLSGTLTSLNCLVFGVVTSISFLIKGFIVTLFSVVISPILQTVLSIQPQTPGFASVILAGWVFIRNLMNVIFIIALIVVAVGTLLRLDEYNYKHLLVEIAIMAVLINFSLVIAQAILGIAQTFQAQFLPNSANVIQNLAASLLVGPYQIPSTFSGIFTQQAPSLASYVSELVSLLFAFASFLAFLVVCAFLLVRIVMLWVLLMVSPVAYGFAVLPQTHHYTHEWWTNFIKYAFFGPVMALFLNLCAYINVSERTFVQTSTNSALATSCAAGAAGCSSGLAAFIILILTNVFIMGCLFAGVELANESAIAGSGFIIKTAEKAFEFPLEAGKEAFLRAKRNASLDLARPDNEGGSALKRLAFRAINPLTSTKSYFHATEEQNEEAEKRVEAAAARMTELQKSGGAVDTRADSAAEREIEAAKQKKYMNNTYEQNEVAFKGLYEHAKEAVNTGKKGTDHNDEKRALLMALLNNGQFKDQIEALLKNEGKEYTKRNVNEFLRNFLDAKNDIESQRFLANDFTNKANEKRLPEAANAYVTNSAGGYTAGDAPVDVFVEDPQGIYTDGDGVRYSFNPRLGGLKEELLKGGEVVPGLQDPDTKGFRPGDTVPESEIAELYNFDSIDRDERGRIRFRLNKLYQPDPYDSTKEFIAPSTRAKLNYIAEGGLAVANNMSFEQAKDLVGADGIDLDSGAFAFKNKKAYERFKVTYLNDDGTIRSNYKDLVVGIWNRYNGNSNQRFMTQTGVLAAYNDAPPGQADFWRFEQHTVDGNPIRTSTQTNAQTIPVPPPGTRVEFVPPNRVAKQSIRQP